MAVNDRELLELAAKAAGLSLVWGEVHRVGDTDVDCTDMAYVVSNDREESPAYWNPLEDDGDALRLAVKLRLDVMFSPMGCYVYAGKNLAADSNEFQIGNESDRSAATRRAIVRAAAALAKEPK